MGQDLDPRATGVFLTAEAALLEARIRILQEAIDEVSTRIERSTKRLRRLREQSHGNPAERPRNRRPRPIPPSPTRSPVTNDPSAPHPVHTAEVPLTKG
ncbi:hypothetical protein [Streptomyces sp. 900105755]